MRELIELLKSVSELSWPVVVLIVVVYLVKNFREPIKEYLKFSPKKVTLPGGVTYESGPVKQVAEKPKVSAEGRLVGVIQDQRATIEYWDKLWFFERI